MVVTNYCSILPKLHICCLIASVGLHLSDSGQWIYYIMEYGINLPFKYILIVIDSNSIVFRGQNMRYWQSATEYKLIQYNTKKKYKIVWCSIENDIKNERGHW